MKRSRFPVKSSTLEVWFYILIAAATGALYLGIGVGAPFLGDFGRSARQVLFGFSQIRWPAGVLVLVAAALILIGISSLPIARLRLSLEPIPVRIGLAVVMTGVFFALRSHFLNPDGAAFADKFRGMCPPWAPM